MKRLIPMVLAVVIFVFQAESNETWRGLTVAPENRCSSYSSRDYSYPSSVEAGIVESLGGAIYGPYTGICFNSTTETDIEHIVARTEAHDSGMCAERVERRRDFARDLLNLTLASPGVNRDQKSDKDAAEWLPDVNQCWFADRVVQVKAKYNLTVDPDERDALEQVLSACESTEMFFSVCTLGPNSYLPHIAQGQGWSTRLYIVNGCDEPVTFRVDLVGHDGAPKSFVVDGSNMRHDAITNGTDPMEARESRLVSFPETGSELIQGYGHLVDNGDGCVVVDTEYRQMLPNGEILFATVPLQQMSDYGSLLTVPVSECTTGIAIAGPGAQVGLHAHDHSGMLLGSVDLGNIHHTAFSLSEKLPQTMSMTMGQVRISGASAALGLDFCNGRLAQFRLTHIVASENGLTGEEVKCGGYLEKCDTNGNGRITCAEARSCGLTTPIRNDHPAYNCMNDPDGDGMVCE